MTLTRLLQRLKRRKVLPDGAARSGRETNERALRMRRAECLIAAVTAWDTALNRHKCQRRLQRLNALVCAAEWKPRPMRNSLSPMTALKGLVPSTRRMQAAVELPAVATTASMRFSRRNREAARSTRLGGASPLQKTTTQLWISESYRMQDWVSLAAALERPRARA